MPVRVYLFKHTANETLERTTGNIDSGLEPDDQKSGAYTQVFTVIVT